MPKVISTWSWYRR